jgi:hypothetical protein
MDAVAGDLIEKDGNTRKLDTVEVLARLGIRECSSARAWESGP